MNARKVCRVVATAVVLAAATVSFSPSVAQEKRLLAVEDIFNLKNVSDPRLSPDGKWVVYTVSRLDKEKDGSDTDIWMAPIDGSDAIRLTTSDKSESSPRWSPDGRYLAFLASRDDKGRQVWLLPLGGGEAFRLTEYKGGVSSMAWSPDASKIAVVVRDPDPDEAEEGEGEGEGEDGGEAASRGARAKAPKPIVVTRLQFKFDGRGYLDERKQHVYVFDVASKESVQVTDGRWDESSPVWSPDGESIAFVSNRTEEPDSNFNNDIFIVGAAANQEPRRLTTSPGNDSSPSFSPDGTFIVYTAGGNPTDIWYATNGLAAVPVDPTETWTDVGVQKRNGMDHGKARILTPGLDRNVSRPTVTPDGTAVLFVLEDQGNRHLARYPIEGGEVERVIAGERTIRAFDMVGGGGAAGGEVVVLETQPHYPPEIYRVEGGPSAPSGSGLARITHVNDRFLASVKLAPVKRFQAPSKDGTLIDAFLTLPPDAPEGERLPTLLRIHGGPVSQFSNAFSFEWQLFTAHGYAVVAANPRGSSGRGRDFSYAIWAAWGTVDFEDVMAAVDHAVEMGVADPEQLGVGGWSYGGILTNYVITQTGRFKAAISGASEVNYTANYGHDHYQRQWEAELGLPWENTELWLQISPFFHVANVTTPTLVMCGQLDWNVPLQNSDQLYQALRRLGVPTELVIYPGQSHGIRRPSYQVDRYERYLAWYDKWVRGVELTDSRSR